ncbi:M20 family metallopeptidase [Siccirubricoccus sp. KC 17139]|uniref:M20 family metallopeptidase n=1 Tax=Siccirubricoccus soli TaxID=2899147 RepID=A0ABT1D1E1_9PROT|nr:M20 aminoacylase family protein [Siccirubricoccus soli]MCO6415728.1 M20 family metallopeptidase [Siccirubricoccus soli]MCP2681860.1 M20 family metallopeptidase [Siccirubricoccus soli]
MPVLNRIAEFHPEMTAWRQDFHAHPETAFEEVRTSRIVAEKLREFGVDQVVTGIAGTGVVGIVRGQGNSGRAIGLRADMDALPILEQTGVPHASTVPGKMHACGHDGHTTMLLGAAKYLAETRNFDGTVYLIFQPAEESGGGGNVMVQEKLFERFPMERVFGMHNWPGAPEGQFLWKVGPVMAATAQIEVVIEGKGAHGAMPHQGNDPVVIAAQLVTALQSVVARNVEPVESGVITIGHIQGGDTWNVIPQSVTLRGTARWFKSEVGDLLEEKFLALATGIPAAFGATAKAVFDRGYPATVNEETSTRLAVKAAEAVAGAAKVQEMPKPTMGGEDFSFMLNAKDGCYIMLGAGRGPADPQVHHPKYDFNDAVLPIGASYWATLAEQLLPRG